MRKGDVISELQPSKVEVDRRSCTSGRKGIMLDRAADWIGAATNIRVALVLF